LTGTEAGAHLVHGQTGEVLVQVAAGSTAVVTFYPVIANARGNYRAARRRSSRKIFFRFLQGISPAAAIFARGVRCLGRFPFFFVDRFDISEICVI